MPVQFLGPLALIYYYIYILILVALYWESHLCWKIIMTKDMYLYISMPKNLS